MNAPGKWAYDPEQRLQGPRREIVQALAGCREVLDVGCWSGYAGRQLLEEGVDAVDGVEPHRAMSERAAAAGYRRVFSEPIDEARASIAPQSYDGVVLYDVIEHLADPWGALAACREWLRPGGLVALSVPNVAFWAVRKQLLRGGFAYADSGIMDRTHLRFFTLATLHEALAAAGLQATREVATGAPFPLLHNARLGQRAADTWPSLFGVQFVWLCRLRET